MLCRNLMPCANNPAFEKGERGLDRVRSDTHALFVPDVFVCAVIDALMLSAIFRHPEVIELRFVSHDDIHGRIHVTSNDVVHGALVYQIGLDEVEMPISLADADNGSLVYELVSVAFAFALSADVCLIHLDRASQLMFCLSHSGADAMAEIPRRLVGDAEHALHLVGGNPLAGFSHQIGNEEPLRQREMGIVEDGSHGYGELIAA